MQAGSAAGAGEDRVTATVPRKRSYFLASAATVLAIGIAAAATWLTAMSFVEAYGIGATHLGQAADPAKRVPPGMEMLVLDAAALLFVAVLARVAFRGFRSPSRD
ncbi:hypothetical protein PV762_27150 [Mitsuaria sp. CC2]|uniref:hypothetical protein n=1 Tax=Mitsuaria sp. CC2 TaxID=3029186 RepID=UPI003B8CFEF3